MLGNIVLTACYGVLAASAPGELSVKAEHDVAVPMRDGVVLRANVFRPDRGGPYPVLVMRTPYSKRGDGRFDRYVKAGYIVVCQDVRGRYASEGQWESFMRPQTHDGEDGYDTVEWAARLPGSTGKVGTFGASYNAFVQWRMAPLRPPSLVAMAAFSIPARYTDLEGPGTIRPGRRLNWWFTTMSPDVRRRANRPDHDRGAVRKAWNSGGREKWMHFLPWLELPREAFEGETDAVHYWLKNPHTDPWKLHEGCKEITVPNLDIIGWHDHCNGDMLLNRTIMAEGKTETARKGSRTIIGPWGHASRGRRKFGKLDFGPEASMDTVALEIRWFEYWLKGKANGMDKTAPVRIFVTGDNQWRDEQCWPLERAKQKVLHLTSSGHANTPKGDGKLWDQAPSQNGSDCYTYDPEDPVPTLHGAASFVIPTDQAPLAHRNDILVYQTEPLTKRIEVTGNPVVELSAASSAPDTDFFVRLIDVAPDGTARDISLGMVRARYRDGLDRPRLIEPNDVVKYTIRMNPTSNAFLPGHRVRLDITSSDFPNYDRNHNTAADQNADAALKTANQRICHGPSHPTRILLPWIDD